MSKFKKKKGGDVTSDFNSIFAGYCIHVIILFHGCYCFKDNDLLIQNHCPKQIRLPNWKRKIG
jgi:hypothetical protein